VSSPPPIIAPPAPAEDLALDEIFAALIVGVTGMSGLFVRPRWQSAVPQQPEPSVDWCAIGVLNSIPDTYAYETHVSGPGITDPCADILIRHETLEVLASFYGPNARANAGLLRDGLQVHQNLEAIEAVDIVLTETEAIRSAPDFINQQWVRRVDMPMRFRRKITRLYAVQNIITATVELQDDSGDVNETFSVPPLIDRPN
jgi:hypothetical protein